MEYSPFETHIESPTTEVLATARELGVALVAYSPLGRGFMTGKYRSPDDFEDGDARKVTPRYSKENFPKNLVLLEKFESIAMVKGCSAGQLALAWLLKQGDDVFPIPGYVIYSSSVRLLVADTLWAGRRKSNTWKRTQALLLWY